MQHRHVVADHGRLADDDGMGVVNHDALADHRAGVDIDPENLADPHLHEIGQVPASAGPEVMRHAVGLHRLIALEVEDRLQEPVAGRITFVDRDEIGARRFHQPRVRGIGLLDHLAHHDHRHLVRGKLCSDPVGQRLLDGLVMQNTGVDKAADQRLILDRLFRFPLNAVPDRVHRCDFSAKLSHRHVLCCACPSPFRTPLPNANP